MSDPYFNFKELDFLKSLDLPETGFLLQINSGVGDALAQFYEIRPKLSLEGVESSWDLRQAFSRNTDHSFSACVWAEEYHEDEESYDVIYLGGMKQGDFRSQTEMKTRLGRYWHLLAGGGSLIIEAILPEGRGDTAVITNKDDVSGWKASFESLGVRDLEVAHIPVGEGRRSLIAARKRSGI